MGDWAENTLAKTINETEGQYDAIHYGDSDTMSAGEPGFKEFYLNRLEDVRIHGKRPDLLLAPKESNFPKDVSKSKTDKLAELVKISLAAIEVRSSKYEALTYMRVRKEQSATGKLSARQTPSFTVKVEDLIIVYRWIESFGCPQVYCQVFFDSVFVINVLRIFEIIGKEDNWRIEKPEKSQLKSTIMIPITEGIQVGKFSKLPSFKAKEKVTYLGRHDAYVVPKGGSLKLDFEKLLATLTQK